VTRLWTGQLRNRCKLLAEDKIPISSFSWPALETIHTPFWRLLDVLTQGQSDQGRSVDMTVYFQLVPMFIMTEATYSLPIQLNGAVPSLNTGIILVFLLRPVLKGRKQWNMSYGPDSYGSERQVFVKMPNQLSSIHREIFRTVTDGISQRKTLSMELTTKTTLIIITIIN
jgi:hypothetical protein